MLPTRRLQSQSAGFPQGRRDYIYVAMSIKPDFVVIAISFAAFVPLACLAQSATTQPAQDPEQAYAQAISRRADDIIAAIGISDAAVAARVHEILVSQYRNLRNLHDQRDAKIRQLQPDQKDQIEQVRAETQQAVRQLHEKFLAQLAAELTPEQIEIVKDRMTYNKLQVTYNSYCQMLPDLTDQQKAFILDALRQAREEAMDGGSAEEKTKIFEKYKGRINNYLSREGYDLKQASRDWAQRRKAQQ